MNNLFKWLENHEYIATWASLIPLLVIAISFIFQPHVNFPSSERCILSKILEDKIRDTCNKINVGDKVPISDVDGFIKREGIDILSAEIEKSSINDCDVTCRVAFNVNIVEIIHTDINYKTSILRVNGTIEE